MKSLILAFGFLFGSVAMAQVSHHGDVIVRYSSTWQTQLPAVAKSLADCRAKIKNIICWVDPMSQDEDQSQGPDQRTCLVGGEKFATHFEGHFDRSPEFIQSMYCHLDKIWVEKDFIATAYASPVIDARGNVTGGGVGIRQEVLDSPMTFDAWLSWKEETSFGGPLKTTDPGLNLINYRSNRDTKEFFFDYVMNHEFGHLFDFSNSLNKLKCEIVKDENGNPRYECQMLPGGWGDLAWLSLFQPKPENNYAFRDKLCFYFCGGNPIAPENADDLFSGLVKTGFHSTYASGHPMEDWAEAFALTIGHDILGLNYGLEIGGRYFDLSQHFYSPVMADKRDYVRKFIAGPKKYPGQK